ncbi:hypothetical protein BIW11_05614 [Tropilaelaps mercedesae]|uniref:Phorbol-ester/DAG-type domain-containing protein n=1 Tax=Tropilaelaps mercedesae TaxID=418985 RepID=A0A1V9Y1J5_9ACAR|nr:hypothetical protein BIW11_05614 [Tropilaelaps mercedesae]
MVPKQGHAWEEAELRAYWRHRLDRESLDGKADTESRLERRENLTSDVGKRKHAGHACALRVTADNSTEDEVARSVNRPSGQTPRKKSATGRPVAAAGLLNSHGGLGSTVVSAADSDDEKFTGKRTKKRGSLFFRKKKVTPKDSTKAGSASPQGSTSSPPPNRAIGHQFVAISYSIGTVQCHMCLKSLENRPALQCELCLVTVHDVHSCRDQFADCTKFKGLLNKGLSVVFPRSSTNCIHPVFPQIGYRNLERNLAPSLSPVEMPTRRLRLAVIV